MICPVPKVLRRVVGCSIFRYNPVCGPETVASWKGDGDTSALSDAAKEHWILKYLILDFEVESHTTKLVHLPEHALFVAAYYAPVSNTMHCAAVFIAEPVLGGMSAREIVPVYFAVVRKSFMDIGIRLVTNEDQAFNLLISLAKALDSWIAVEPPNGHLDHSSLNLVAGEKVEFSKALCTMLSSLHCIVVSSCADKLRLWLKALSIFVCGDAALRTSLEPLTKPVSELYLQGVVKQDKASGFRYKEPGFSVVEIDEPGVKVTSTISFGFESTFVTEISSLVAQKPQQVVETMMEMWRSAMVARARNARESRMKFPSGSAQQLRNMIGLDQSRVDFAVVMAIADSLTSPTSAEHYKLVTQAIAEVEGLVDREKGLLDSM